MILMLYAYCLLWTWCCYMWVECDNMCIELCHEVKHEMPRWMLGHIPWYDEMDDEYGYVMHVKWMVGYAMLDQW